jgi:large exoprotein involved in heme utilization and adhesion
MTISATDSITVSSGAKIRMGVIQSPGGLLEISAPTITIDQASLQTATAGVGDAGAISLTTGILNLVNGATITSDTTQIIGRGGPITITASDAILISGGSAIQSNSANNGGQAGTIGLTARNVSISGSNSGLFSETSGTGRGGDVSIYGNQVLLSSGATISAKSTGTGNAGDVLVKASDSLVVQNSSITTEATLANGGNITLHAGRLLRLINAEITTHAAGDGGKITIDPEFIIVEDASQLITSAGVNGGDITLIATKAIFISGDSIIDASGSLGISGEITIQAPVTSLSGTLAPLPGEIVQAAELLQARCAARIAGGTSGSFVVAGRDGVPLEPGGLLPSPLYVESPGSTRMAGALDVPGLRVGRTFTESNFTLAPLASGCSS